MRNTFFCSLFIAAALFVSGCSPLSSANLKVPIAEKSQSIIGGSPAAENEFPFVVNIWINMPKDNYVAHLCGGSLISKKWVLTAAHCMMIDHTESEMRVMPASFLDLYIGSSNHSGAGGRKLKAKSIRVHPDYNWPNHDVALVELAEEVTDISPILLNDQDLGAATDLATVIGWGLTDAAGKTEAELLQKVTLSLVPREICSQDPFPQSNKNSVGANMLCTQTLNHQTSSCPGDSGGPLFQVRDGKFLQIGIVSWSSACSGKRFSYRSSVAGYSDVANALSWIRNVVK